jgi:hypothetical protein
MYSKFWTRESVADLALPDGHKVRIAVETRLPEWVAIKNRNPAVAFDPDGWDGTPESRVIFMHDDWPDLEKRLRTYSTWNSQTCFDPNHVFGIAWLLDRLSEDETQLPGLLCSEFAIAFGNMMDGIFSDCAFFMPREGSAQFPEYSEIYLEPALAWLLNCDEEGFEDTPLIDL